MRISLNNNWLYTPNFTPALCGAQADVSALQSVRLPHTNAEVPLHYFDEKQYQFISGYRCLLPVDRLWQGKCLLLHFEGVAHVAHVYVNGALIAQHLCGYTAFTVELAPYINWEGENVLCVQVDSTENPAVPPFGNVVDYLAFGGIYREVYLDVKEPCHVEDVFVTTPQVDAPTKPLHVAVTVHGNEMPLQLRYTVWHGETRLAQAEHKAQTGKNTIEIQVQGAQNWSVDAPMLYTLQTQLLCGEQELDAQQTRFGFRTCRFEADGFWLNGEKIKLRGLNRHQSYPYVGYAMPASAQIADADMAKYELGLNAVRTSHYPQSQHFVHRCDELGLLVFTELPGWQHIGDEAWQAIACQNVQEMVLQYRNHPSIVLWGVRINESADSDDFYRRTNAIAHELDGSRQTGGVRCHAHSHLLEEVYTYNDFAHRGHNNGLAPKRKITKESAKPYLVTEYNGHMYPTKAFDSEAHRLSHALRHAKVLEDLYAAKDITGAFGWCMFDYNTHKDFGSGDKICYHGVMDAFRNPKMAAAVYASQSEETPVLEISSTMDIGEHAASSLGTVVAFTNADCVRVYKNNEFVIEYSAKNERSAYAHLPHPPILMNDFVGELLEKNEGYSHRVAQDIKAVLRGVAQYGQDHLPLRILLKMAKLLLFKGFTVAEGYRLFGVYMGNWGTAATTYRFEAVQQGKIVKTVTRASVERVTLCATPHKTQLQEGSTYDVACVRLNAVDQNGNRLPFYNGAVKLQITGALALIGPDVISLAGGMGGTYVKTTGELGEGTLTAQCAQAAPVVVHFTVQ